MNLAKEIWEKLSVVDVSDHTEKKGKFTYLSWAWAWAEFSKHYPNCDYKLSDRILPDGTMEVGCKMKVFNEAEIVKRNMWLPVLNNSNKAIQNPNAFDINTAKMRCLVKCLAMYGLGHYIYAGEDIPDDGSEKPKSTGFSAADQNTIDEDDKPWFNDDDLDKYRGKMIERIQGGEHPDEIAKSLRKTFKVSRKMAEQIGELV